MASCCAWCGLPQSRELRCRGVVGAEQATPAVGGEHVGQAADARPHRGQVHALGRAVSFSAAGTIHPPPRPAPPPSRKSSARRAASPAPPPPHPCRPPPPRPRRPPLPPT